MDIQPFVDFMSWYDEVEFVRKQARLNNELFADSLPMIASENVLSPLCREMLITDFHGRYAEGTPGHRYYEGCDIFDHGSYLSSLLLCNPALSHRQKAKAQGFCHIYDNCLYSFGFHHGIGYVYLC